MVSGSAHSFAQTGPASLNLSGALFDSNSQPLLGTSVTFQVDVWDANASCLLYTETHAGQDLSTTNGAFSLQLGAGTSQTNYLQGSSAFDTKLFLNSGATGAFSGCPAGVTLASGSSRLIRVHYNMGSGLVTMTPDVPITSTPFAMVADSLQGFAPSNFILTNTNTSLLQANVENVFSNTNYPILQSLLSGTGYIPSSPTSAVSFNSQRLTNVANPTAAQDVATKSYADGTVAGSVANVAAVGVGFGGGDTLVWNQTTGQWVAQPAAGSVTNLVSGTGLVAGSITSTGTLAVDVGTSAYKILQLNSLAQLPAVDGSLLTNLNASRLGGRAVSAAAPIAGQVLTWNTTTAQWDAESTNAVTALTGDVVATGPGSVAATIQPNAVTSAKINNVGVAVNRLLITDAVTGTSVTYSTCSLNQILQWTASGWACTNVAAMLGNNGVTAGVYGSTTQVAQVGVDATGRVTSLTNVNIAFPVASVAGRTGAVTLSAGDINGLGTAATQTVGTGPNDVVELNGSSQLPAVNGSLLTNVNATTLAGYNVSSVAPTANQVLMFNASSNSWQASADPGFSGFSQGGNSFGATGVLGTKDANALQLIAGNSTAMTILTNGYVGIGTASPQSPLHVSGGNMIVDSSRGIQFGTAAFAQILGSSGAGSYLRFINSGVENMRLTVGGQLGIGTTSPGNLLDVNGSVAIGTYTGTTSGSANSLIVSGNVGIGTASPVNGLDLSNGEGFHILAGVPASTSAALYNNGGVLMWNGTALASGGSSLAITGGTLSGGLTISSGGLSVAGGVNNGNGGITNAGSITGVAGNITGSGALTLAAGGSNKNLTLSGSGTGNVLLTPNVGIGTTSAQGVLDVYATTSSVHSLIVNSTTGYVGIGTISPVSALEVASGGLAIDGNLLNRTGSTSYGLSFDSNDHVSLRGQSAGLSNLLNLTNTFSANGSGENISFLNNSVTNAQISEVVTGTNTADLYFTTGLAATLSEKMRITSTGNVGIGTTSPNGILDVEGSSTVIFNAGNVGVGTTSPSSAEGTLIQVQNNLNDGTVNSNATVAAFSVNRNASLIAAAATSGTAQVLFRNSGVDTTTGQGWIAYDNSTDLMRFGTNAANHMVLDTNGNVGIGTASPTNLLSLDGSAARTIWMEREPAASVAAGNKLTLQAGGASLGGTNLAGGNLILSSGTSTGSAFSQIQLQTTPPSSSGTADNAPTPVMTIYQAYNGGAGLLPRVGIGTTSPGDSLDVQGGANGSGGGHIMATNTLSASGAWGGFQGYGTTGTSIDLGMPTALYNADPLVGAYGPGAGFLRTASWNGLVIAAESSNGPILFGTGGNATTNERLRISPTGNVGIGTTGPLAILDINGLGTLQSAMIVPRDSTTNRPSSPVNGMIRYNTSTSAFEGYSNGSWGSLAASTGALSGTSEALSGGLTIAAGGESLTGGLNNNSGGITGAGSITGIGTNLTGAGALTVAAGGSNQNLTLSGSGTGQVLLTPNVGIGTTSAVTSLQVAGSTYASGGVSLGTGVDGFYSPSAGTIQFHNNGSDRWVMTLSNFMNTTGSGPGIETVSQPNFRPRDGETGGLGWVSTGVIALYENGSPVLTVNGSNVGIGTTSPAAVFDVEGSGTVVLNTGSVGVGTSSPIDSLSVVGSANGSGGGHITVRNTNSGGSARGAVIIYNDAGTTNEVGNSSSTFSAWPVIPIGSGYMMSGGQYGMSLVAQASSVNTAIRFATGGTATTNERMRIDVNGNVGIGTNSPTSMLQVHGGSIVADANSGSAQSVIFTTGNMQVTSYNSSTTINVCGLKDGGNYTLVLTGYPASTTVTFNAYTDTGCSASTHLDFGGSTSGYTNTFTTANNTTVISIVYSSTQGVAYASGVTNFYH